MKNHAEIDHTFENRRWMRQTLQTLRVSIRAGPPLLFFFLTLVIIFNVLPSQWIFEAPLFLLVMNTLFLSIIPFAVALIALRGYIAGGSANLFFLGCGMLSLGLVCFIAGWLGAQAQANANITIHNTGLLLASVFNLLAGAALSSKKTAQKEGRTQKKTAAIFAYLGILIFTAGLSFAALRGYTPPFSVPGSGPTLLREVILAAATIFFGVSCLLIVIFDRDRRSFFLSCYAVALGLITVGLIALMTSKQANNPLSWLGRSAQYVAGIYFLAAVVAAARTAWANRWTVPDTVADFLRPSEALYRDLVEAATDAIIPINMTGEILLWNAAASHMFGYNRMEAVKLTPADLIDPEESKRLFREIQTGMAGGQGSYVGRPREVKARGKGGHEFPVELSFSSRRSGGGWIGTLIIRDITERKRADETLRKERDFTSAVLKNTGGLVVVLDRKGRITRFNRTCEVITGYTFEEVANRVFWEFLVPPDELPGVKETWDALSAGDFPNQHENHWVARDGSQHLITWSNTAIVSPRGDVEYVIGTGLDTTERKRAEEALQRQTLELQRLTETLEERVRERTAELAALSEQLVSAQENERRRISYDLHDNAWQMLVAIRFEIERLFSAREGMDWTTLQDKAKKVMAAILETVGKIRSMQGDLWPYALDDIGILATIGWYCREFQKSHPDLTIERLDGLAENEIPSSAKIVIYRILQETLSNVTKHSQATRVTLRLMKKDHRMEFTVEDNGIGFDPEETIVKRSPWGGLGLLNIKARTELSGGTFGVESVKGKGTTVRASWPI